MPRSMLRLSMTLVFAGLLLPASGSSGQDLSGYFGFDGLEVVKIDRGAGPLLTADMNGDGLQDLIVVNNHASRIEIHYQRVGVSPGDPPRRPLRVNETPEHWRYRHENVSVVHRVTAVMPFDYDGDGLMDLVYAGLPGEVVFMRQSTAGVFEMAGRNRVRRLAANRNGFAVANLIGDDALELVAVVGSTISLWPVDGARLGTPTVLAVGDGVAGFMIEDFTGDGQLDLAAMLPGNAAPIRVWPGSQHDGLRSLSVQLRFEMPALVEADAIRLPGSAAARLLTIEQSTRRVVVHELATESVEASGNREAAVTVRGFTTSDRGRQHVVIDLDGDGQLDLVTTDNDTNALAAYFQKEGEGMGNAASFPTLSSITHLVAGNVDDDPEAELFVLSEKEGVVGRSDVVNGEIGFPAPLPIPTGLTPTALNLIELSGVPVVAVVAKKSRDYVLVLLGLDGTSETVSLGKLSRSPDGIVAIDADLDQRTDLLVFTRDKPMMMLHASEDGFELRENDDMGQYGLVEAATRENTARIDIDGDGAPELVVVDRNFIRAVRYDPDPPAGVSPGWQVVRQINVDEGTASLASIASLDANRMTVADKENNRLLIIERDDAGNWSERDRLTVRGFSLGRIHPGSFSGDGAPDVLVLADDGFATIRLGGERTLLHETASWRPDDERRIPHEFASGDLNGDGFIDLVSLDAGEQMCEILSFSEAERLLYATGFQVFESRLFSGSDSRLYEPSQAIIADVTGDGANDLILLAHDRILIYPQMTVR